MASVTIKTNKDVSNSSILSDENFGDSDKLGMGYKDPNINRTFLGFDLSLIPTNAVIIEAKLHMHQRSIASWGSITFDIYRVTGAWTENVLTWNNQPAVEGTPTITGLTCAHIIANTWRDWTVTSLITEMITNSADSMMLRIQTESGADESQVFSSKEYGTDYQPYLIITYELPSKVNVGDAWKPASDMKVNVGDAWKLASGMKVNIGDAWKEVF